MYVQKIFTKKTNANGCKHHLKSKHYNCRSVRIIDGSKVRICCPGGLNIEQLVVNCLHNYMHFLSYLTLKWPGGLATLFYGF